MSLSLTFDKASLSLSQLSSAILSDTVRMELQHAEFCRLHLAVPNVAEARGRALHRAIRAQRAIASRQEEIIAIQSRLGLWSAEGHFYG